MQCIPIWLQVSLILAALVGRPVESSQEWVTCPPQVTGLAGAAGQRGPAREGAQVGVNVRAGLGSSRR